VKAAELRGLSEDQLEDRLRDLHEEWRDLRFQEAIGRLTATARTREIRKTIARIHTIRTERATDAARAALLAERGGGNATATAATTTPRRFVIEEVRR
jgi:large subunit ribosomal protein L29